MRTKEIAECCHAIDHLRKFVIGLSKSDPKRLEFISDLLVTYQDLQLYMQEEIDFLKSISIK